jgi:hypothetical protein
VKRNILYALVLTGYVMGAHAEDQTTAPEQTQSTMKLNPAEGGQTTPVKDIDDEITNARMRATLGSKNRFSFKSALGYSGGSVKDPMNEVRPNYRAGANREALPQLAGTLGINYRATERDNLTLGFGLAIMDPFHGGITKPAYDGRKGSNYGNSVSRYQPSTPSLDWSRGYKAFGTQMISGATASYYSDSDSGDINAIGDFAISQTILANLGDSKWQGGISAVFDYSIYGGDVKSNVSADYASGTYKRDDMMVAIYPFAEYSFTDRYSFRTVFGYFEFAKYKDEYNNNTTYRQVEPYQSAGVGISITRDIYLYPNIQFAPKDIRADRTNVALSTNINI